MVVERTDVADHFVAEVSTCRYIHHVDEVIGNTIVVVQRTGHAAIEETEVKTGAIGSGFLPGQFGIDGIRTIVVIECEAIGIGNSGTGAVVNRLAILIDTQNITTTYGIISALLSGIVGSEVGIVTLVDFLLTGDTVVETELQLGNGIVVTQSGEGLLHLPTQSNRGEVAPAVVFVET